MLFLLVFFAEQFPQKHDAADYSAKRGQNPSDGAADNSNEDGLLPIPVFERRRDEHETTEPNNVVEPE